MAMNPFFNANVYVGRNPDLVRAGLNTAEQLWNHYVQYGAQESTAVDVRAPNSWFDVNYYLASYPDLVKNGINAASALDHFYHYGINEARSFNPIISAADFDAQTYAAENEDLREAFGIEDDTELTAENKAALLKHYLAYGYAENRKGVGEFADVVNAANVLRVANNPKNDGLINTKGSIADDLFLVDGKVTAYANQVIDGFGGTDTVRFEEATILDNANSQSLLLRNIENIVLTNSLVYVDVANQVDHVTLNGLAALYLSFEKAAVAGADDILNVRVNADQKGSSSLPELALLVVNGFETINVELNKDSTIFILAANETTGSRQTINLRGGNTDTGLTFALENASSPKLDTVTLNGEALMGGISMIAIGEEASNVNNVIIKGAKNTTNNLETLITDEDASSRGMTLTLIGGDKADTLVASGAIDVLTGGKGVNTFVFAGAAAQVKLNAAGKISAMDRITDLKKGDLLAIDNTGIVTFTQTGSALALQSLEEAVAAAAAIAIDGASKSAVAFEFDGLVYLYLGGYSKGDLGNVELIQISGATVDNLVTWDIIAA